MQMRALWSSSTNLPPSVREARELGDEAVARALIDLGLDCPDVKALLDREDCPVVDA